jgi:hypothetical protein
MSSRKRSFGSMVGVSAGSALIAAFLIMLVIQSSFDGILTEEWSFFAFVIGTILASVSISIIGYDKILKEKIQWGY